MCCCHIQLSCLRSQAFPAAMAFLRRRDTGAGAARSTQAPGGLQQGGEQINIQEESDLFARPQDACQHVRRKPAESGDKRRGRDAAQPAGGEGGALLQGSSPVPLSLPRPQFLQSKVGLQPSYSTAKGAPGDEMARAPNLWARLLQLLVNASVPGEAETWPETTALIQSESVAFSSR